MVLMGPQGRTFPLAFDLGVSGNSKVKLDATEGDPCERRANRQSACVLYSNHVGVTPPAANWSRLKVQLYGVKDDAQVFVSGLMASHEGGRIWSYWGAANNPANMTIVADGTAIFRRKVVSSIENPAVVTIPGNKVSKR
jgi:hypothetical protein